jgi:putative ABC transport system permease protein
VTLDLRGHSYRLRVATVLGREAAGALSGALVAVMPLANLQQLAALPKRITRILVQTAPGQQAAVAAGLRRLAAGRLTVTAADEDVGTLRQALGPSALASGLFAAIGALLGLLFAFNAILLTVPERRQTIADLRLAGTRRTALVQMVLFQAICLGLSASLAGLAVGYALSVGVFHQSSAYLSEAFTLAGGTVVGLRPVLLSLVGGVLVTCLASAVPLLDLRRGRTRDAVYEGFSAPGNALGQSARRRLSLAAIALGAVATALYLWVPSAAIAATAALAVATVLAVPLTFACVLGSAALLNKRFERLTTLPIALASLRATTLRSLALAATGAVALFGSVALGGSRENLLHGIGGFAHSYVSDANIWVGNPGDSQATNDFRAEGLQQRIAQLPGVASVSAFQGGFLELAKRRVWILARPPGASAHVLSSQTVAGSASEAIARLHQGGWIAVSEKIAQEHHIGVGGVLALPTPSGRAQFRIAATTTNLAWPPGVIFMGSGDYARAWRTRNPTTLGVNLRPNADPLVVRHEIASSLGGASGLAVSLASSRERRINALTSEGLGQLGEISTLLLLAAITAMAAALASSVWQRRAWLAELRLAGAKPGRLRRILLMEASLMLGSGCLTGALMGIYGQVGIDGYLRHVTGFPLTSSLVAARPLGVLLLVLSASMAIVLIPGWLASRVPPILALERE